MDLGTSAATLVSNSPTEIEKIKRSKRTYLTIVGSLTLVVVLLVVAGLLVDQVVRSSTQLNSVRQELRDAKLEQLSNQDKPAVCWTKECIISAAALMESIDETVDPCQDFYKFACGGWKKKNAIPGGHGGISQFSILDSRIRQFIQDFFRENNTAQDSKAVNSTRDMYNACTNTDAIEKLGLEPMIEVLNSYGQWPMTVKNWTEDRFDWTKVSASIRSTFGYNFFFEVSNFLDIENTDLTTIYIDQPYLGLPSFLLKNQTLTSEEIVAYATFVYRVAVLIRDTIGGDSDNSTIVEDIEDMITFHIELANILTPDEFRGYDNITQLYNPFFLHQLQNLTDESNVTNQWSQINWHEHLNDIYSVANVTIEHDERIIVLEPGYIQRLVELLDQTSPRVLANFIHWRLVFESIPNLNQEIGVLAIKFWDTIFGPYPLPPRKPWCMWNVERMMGFAIGSKYIESNFDPRAKSNMQEMVVHLKLAFSALVEEADWMDRETKINALEKAAAMKEYIAYPDWINNRTTLDYAYRGIETRPDRHFANLLSAYRFMVANNLRFLRIPTNRENLWISFPAVVNAFYFPMLNSITFPAGILNPPFYGRGRLAASNYGAIGAVIGHEITHGFDHNGHKSDKKGHFKSWWTNQTLSEFYKRKECIVEQYGNYTFPGFEGTDAYNMSGTRTQGENIADNGGLREAFRAYKNYVSLNGQEPRLPGLESYSPEQIFFLSYATMWCNSRTPNSLANQILYGVHSPGRYRVIGPLSNSVDFAEHFQCAAGSPMNKSKKCIVW